MLLGRDHDPHKIAIGRHSARQLDEFVRQVVAEYGSWEAYEQATVAEWRKKNKYNHRISILRR